VASGPQSFANEDEEIQYYLGLLEKGDRYDSVVARAGLAPIFERREMLEQAAECYETNIRVGVRDPAVYERLARVYRKQGRVELADEVLEEAEKLRIRTQSATTRRMASVRTPSRSRAEESVGAATHPMRSATSRSLARAPSSANGRRATPSGPPRPWYAATPTIILSVLLLGPIGLTLMWIKAPWTTATKWVVSGVWWGTYLLLVSFSARSSVDAIATMIAGQATSPTAAVTPVVTPSLVATAPAVALSPSPAAAKPTQQTPAAQAQQSPAAATPAPPPATAAPQAPQATPAPKPTAAPPAPGVIGGKNRIANTDGGGVNLRDRPSAGGAALKLVDEGAIVDVVGPDVPSEGKTWRNVRDAGGTIGWITTEFLAEV
jgi:hypothetical protein